MRSLVLLILSVTSAASLASATPIPSGGAAKFASVQSRTAPPHGYVQFCVSRPNYCRGDGRTVSRVKATAARLSELDIVNRQVNKAIKPVEDREQYGVEEFWTFPTTGKGDCEEYVLLKRERLIRRRWPTGSLLITVVLDENRQGHAVLTARTSAGDLILDNKHDDIKLWSKTPYIYLMRQSYLDPNVWFALTPASQGASAATAGTEANDWSPRVRQ